MGLRHVARILGAAQNQCWTMGASASKEPARGGRLLPPMEQTVTGPRGAPRRETIGEGESVIRNLVGAFALACACLLGFAREPSVAKDDAKPAAMRFEWRMEGPAEECGQFCRRWISATGVVAEGSARDFEVF